MDSRSHHLIGRAFGSSRQRVVTTLVPRKLVECAVANISMRFVWQDAHLWTALRSAEDPVRQVKHNSMKGVLKRPIINR